VLLKGCLPFRHSLWLLWFKFLKTRRQEGVRPVKRLALIIPMYSYIHFITIPESVKRVNTWKRKCWSGGEVGMMGYLAVVGEQPSDPCKHGKVTLNWHHHHHHHQTCLQRRVFPATVFAPYKHWPTQPPSHQHFYRFLMSATALSQLARYFGGTFNYCNKGGSQTTTESSIGNPTNASIEQGKAATKVNYRIYKYIS